MCAFMKTEYTYQCGLCCLMLPHHSLILRPLLSFGILPSVLLRQSLPERLSERYISALLRTMLAMQGSEGAGTSTASEQMEHDWGQVQ